MTRSSVRHDLFPEYVISVWSSVHKQSPAASTVRRGGGLPRRREGQIMHESVPEQSPAASTVQGTDAGAGGAEGTYGGGEGVMRIAEPCCL